MKEDARCLCATVVDFVVVDLHVVAALRGNDPCKDCARTESERARESCRGPDVTLGHLFNTDLIIAKDILYISVTSNYVLHRCTMPKDCI